MPELLIFITQMKIYEYWKYVEKNPGVIGRSNFWVWH